MGYAKGKGYVILRNLNEHPGKAVLVTGGAAGVRIVHEFDGRWEDGQIWEAVRLANEAYDAGFRIAQGVAMSVLRDMVDALPINKDWLDPALEKEARDILEVNPL
jgi:hypothetical protein